MKILILETDRYGERAIQKDTVELPIEKFTKKLVNQAYKASKFFDKDCNDEGECFDSDEEFESYETHLMDEGTIISKDGSTAHHTGEEIDYIFLIV